MPVVLNVFCLQICNIINKYQCFYILLIAYIHSNRVLILYIKDIFWSNKLMRVFVSSHLSWWAGCWPVSVRCHSPHSRNSCRDRSPPESRWSERWKPPAPPGAPGLSCKGRQRTWQGGFTWMLQPVVHAVIQLRFTQTFALCSNKRGYIGGSVLFYFACETMAHMKV